MYIQYILPEFYRFKIHHELANIGISQAIIIENGALFYTARVIKAAYQELLNFLI
jgi:hypothetical protein